MAYALESGAADSKGQTKVAFGDSGSVDAFSRLRVSTPVGIFDSSFQYDLQPQLFWQDTANGGTIAHTAASSSATLSTAAQASSRAILQSKQYHRYVPAKSQMIAMTMVMGSGVSGVVKRAGYFDANDGIFLEQNGVTDVAFVRRTSTSGTPVDNRVVQSAWNLDTLLGTAGASNPSGLTLDLSKASILIVDLQWLGMGRVRVGFDIGGLVIYVHEFKNANVLTLPYMKTANLPIRWEIAGNGVASLLATCSAVISEGGIDFDRGYTFAQASDSITAGSGARTAIVCIRPKATFNSITNRVIIIPEMVSGLVTGQNPVLWELLYNPTIGGGAWASADSNSVVEYNITATSVTSGSDVEAFFSPASVNSSSAGVWEAGFTRLPIVVDMTGANPIAVALCATGLGGTSAVRGAMTWRELR